MKRFFLLIALLLIPALGASASTVNLNFTINFSAQKIQHDCIGLFGGGVVSQGDCGAYQGIALGSLVSGQLSAFGPFSEAGGVFSTSGFVSPISQITCTVGGANCNTPSESEIFTNISAEGARFANFGLPTKVQAGLTFDFIAGTGTIDYEDDSFPVFARIRFDLTNVVVTGLPTPVPLPASALLLGAACAWPLAWRAKRRGSRRMG